MNNGRRAVPVYAGQHCFTPKQARNICRMLHDECGCPDVHEDEIRYMLYNYDYPHYAMPIMKVNPKTKATIWCDRYYIACVDEWTKFRYAVIFRQHALEELNHFKKVTRERGEEPDIPEEVLRCLNVAHKFMKNSGRNSWINPYFDFIVPSYASIV